MWRDVSNNAKFWKWARVVIAGPESFKANMRRLKLVPDMKILFGTRPSIINSILKSICKGRTKLKNIKMPLSPISSRNINRRLLSSAIIKLEKIHLMGGSIMQLEEILFNIIVTKKIVLKHFKISQFSNFPKLPPFQLGMALNKIESFSGGPINCAQLTEILKTAASRDSKLRKILFTTTKLLDISNLDSHIVSEALLNLERIDGLQNVRFSTQQNDYLLDQIRKSDNFRLTNIDLQFNISHVPPAVLVEAISKLHTVRFIGTRGDVTNHQLASVLYMLRGDWSGGESKLKQMRIDWFNLSLFRSDFFMKAIKKLELIEFSHTILTAEQIDTIVLMAITRTNGLLKKIYIEDPIIIGQCKLLCPSILNYVKHLLVIKPDNMDLYQQYDVTVDV